MKRKIGIKSGIVTFTFDGLEPLTISYSDMCADAQAHAWQAGVIQCAGDEAAISKTAENNYTVTEAMRREAVAAKLEQFRTVGWYATVKAQRVKSAEEIARLTAENARLIAEMQALIDAGK